MKKQLPTILTIILAFNLSGCTYYLNNKSSTEKKVDIIMAETYKKYEDREVVFEKLSIDFTPYYEEPVTIANQSKQEFSRLADDNSQINTLYDGFGNKTETRLFFNDRLIKFVIIKTWADGSKKAFVFAQNGEVKAVTEEMLKKILDLPSDEIARSVEIFEGRKENELIAGLTKNHSPQTVSVNALNPNPAQTIKEPVNPNLTGEVNLTNVKTENEVKVERHEEFPKEK